jgi:hypothetical protein
LCLIFATAASSSRSHVPVETCGRHSTPNLGRTVLSVRRCPPQSMAIVIHFVTRRSRGRVVSSYLRELPGNGPRPGKSWSQDL